MQECGWVGQILVPNIVLYNTSITRTISSGGVCVRFFRRVAICTPIPMPMGNGARCADRDVRHLPAKGNGVDSLLEAGPTMHVSSARDASLGRKSVHPRGVSVRNTSPCRGTCLVSNVDTAGGLGPTGRSSTDDTAGVDKVSRKCCLSIDLLSGIALCSDFIPIRFNHFGNKMVSTGVGHFGTSSDGIGLNCHAAHSS